MRKLLGLLLITFLTLPTFADNSKNNLPFGRSERHGKLKTKKNKPVKHKTYFFIKKCKNKF